MRFVEVWPDQTEVTTLAQHLGWSHFKEILYLDSELASQFYAEWVVLSLGHPIQFVIPRSSRNEAPVESKPLVSSRTRNAPGIRALSRTASAVLPYCRS